MDAKAFAKSRDERKRELSLKVGDGENRKGGILWGFFTPPLPTSYAPDRGRLAVGRIGREVM